LKLPQQLVENLNAQPKLWALTGAAGFIGSNLLEALLRCNQQVIALDNFSTGKQGNLDEVRQIVGETLWKKAVVIRGDIVDLDTCKRLCAGADFVLHQAAVGSVPRSIADPLGTHENNVDGFLNMLCAAKEAKVKRFVYASSSSVYGDHPALPKVEHSIGSCLSPYAVSKRINELYAEVFSKCYGTESVGLRYFNVFGPRQDPNGMYAAVIPKWISALLKNEPVYINGDGATSRDFCFVANVVQANLLAATTQNAGAMNEIYNIAVAQRTTLNQLFESLRTRLAHHFPQVKDRRPVYRSFREGDVIHSHADIGKALQFLGYRPTHDVDSGLTETVAWYIKHTEGPRSLASAAATAR
jgi:UDP-N-acetylglucosamine/UDP-N-acetylgalactosamine 4-epimerase